MNAPDFSSLGLFGTGLSQHARLITLTTAQDSGLPEALAAERFTGREAVNELFSFDIDALSTSTDLDLSIFLGEELTVGLMQPDGDRRQWHGICTGSMWLGADGGVARYRLRLEPLEGGDITFACPGKFSVKGGKHTWDSPSRESATLVRLPDSELKTFDEAFILTDAATGKPLADIAYRVKHADGTYEYGRTDERRVTHLIGSGDREKLAIEVNA
ncbi:MAG: type secretion system tip protein VgrG [Massilia sp.]|nr:type secretion system tip protein VgrG [Massilia sp.]